MANEPQPFLCRFCAVAGEKYEPFGIFEIREYVLKGPGIREVGARC